jgi:hypothetical protein
MAATADIKHARWPRDLKAFALFAAIWAAWLTARIVLRDLTYYAQAPIEAVILGMKFDGLAARMVLAVQAIAVATLALGLAAQRKWGLRFALLCLLEVVVSNLIFMMAYMDDIAESSNVRLAGILGIGSVLLLLYLWVRAQDLMQDENPST